MTRAPAAKPLIIGNASCPDCQEICRTQRFCATCNKPTKSIRMAAPARSGSAKVYGTDELQFWRCGRCGMAWDGGRFYGFACLAHGGQDPPEHPETKTIDDDTRGRSR